MMLRENHNAKATVDDSGKSHNNVLIIDGDAGDKVRLMILVKLQAHKLIIKAILIMFTTLVLTNSGLIQILPLVNLSRLLEKRTLGCVFL